MQSKIRDEKREEIRLRKKNKGRKKVNTPDFLESNEKWAHLTTAVKRSTSHTIKKGQINAPLLGIDHLIN